MMTHEMFLLLGVVSAGGLLVAKARVIARCKPGALYLRLSAMLAALWFMVVWILTLAGSLAVDPQRVFLLLPATIVLLWLEILHTLVEW
jgi:hypothetical protein